MQKIISKLTLWYSHRWNWLNICKRQFFCQQKRKCSKAEITVVCSYLLSFQTSLTIDATVLQVRMSRTLCPASLKYKPWLMIWSIIVPRISLETWTFFLLLLQFHHTCTTLPQVPLPWQTKQQRGGIFYSWITTDWRAAQRSLTKIHWLFTIMQVISVSRE